MLTTPAFLHDNYHMYVDFVVQVIYSSPAFYKDVYDTLVIKMIIL